MSYDVFLANLKTAVPLTGGPSHGLVHSANTEGTIAPIKEIAFGNDNRNYGATPISTEHDDTDGLKTAIKMMDDFYGRMAAPFAFERWEKRKHQPSAAQRAVDNVTQSRPMFPLAGHDRSQDRASRAIDHVVRARPMFPLGGCDRSETNPYAHAILKDTEAMTVAGSDLPYTNEGFRRGFAKMGIMGSDLPYTNEHIRQRLARYGLLGWDRGPYPKAATAAQKVVNRVVNSQGMFGGRPKKRVTASYLAHAFDCRDTNGNQLPEAKKQKIRSKLPSHVFAGPYKTACMVHAVELPDGSLAWKFDERCIRRAIHYVNMLADPQRSLGKRQLEHGVNELRKAQK